MVIINNQTSQLANRLWQFSTFIANSIEYKYKLVNIGFFKYLPFFECTASNNFKGLPITITRTHIRQLDYFYSNLFKNWSSFTYRKFKKTPTLGKFYRTTFTNDIDEKLFDLNDPQFVHDAQTRRVLVEGWWLRDSVNMQKHASIIRNLFIPVEPYRSEVKKVIAEARQLADIVVGVHIRRRDYISYQGGIWYFDDKTYLGRMLGIADYYKNIGKTCVFLMCSDENINSDNFEGLNILLGQRHFIVDLYSLSECDLIIGPPSTYNQWAAYYGDKPLSIIVDESTKSLEYNVLYMPSAVRLFDNNI